MAIQGLPAGGFTNVGQIVGSNFLRFHPTDDIAGIAIGLLASHLSGGPVVDDNNRFIGFISEFDILRAYESGMNLGQSTASDIMNHALISVNDGTTIAEAVEIMEANRLLVLPVVKDGMILKSITRHDLLRAVMGVGIGVDG